jgi:hypothetical protein
MTLTGVAELKLPKYSFSPLIFPQSPMLIFPFVEKNVPLRFFFIIQQNDLPNAYTF